MVFLLHKKDQLFLPLFKNKMCLQIGCYDIFVPILFNNWSQPVLGSY